MSCRTLLMVWPKPRNRIRNRAFKFTTPWRGSLLTRHRFWVAWGDVIASKLAPTGGWRLPGIDVGASLLAMAIFNSPQASQPSGSKLPRHMTHATLKNKSRPSQVDNT